MTRTAAVLALLLALGILALGLYVSRSAVSAEVVGPSVTHSPVHENSDWASSKSADGEQADNELLALPSLETSPEPEAKRATVSERLDVHLRIVAASTGLPIKGARVSINPEEFPSEVSDKSGVVRMACPHAVEAGSRCTVGLKGDVRARGFAKYDITGLPPAGELPQTIELQRNPSLRFIARDSSGNPLAGVQVSATIVKVNPTIEPLVAGESLIARDADPATTFARAAMKDVVSSLDSTRSQGLHTNLKREPVGKPAENVGRVTNLGRVTLTGAATANKPRTITRKTGANGEATIEDLPSGQPIEIRIGEAKEVHDLGILVLGPREERVIDWTLPARPSIAGRCVAIDGSPAVGVPIGLWGPYEGEATECLMSVNQTALSHSTSDDQGEFHFERVPFGSWFVGPDPMAAHPLAGLARRVDLTSHFQARMDFRLGPMLEVAGTLRGEDGLALGDVVVRLQPLWCAGELRTTADSRGRWILGPLAPGEYQVEVLRDTEVLLRRTASVDYPSPYKLELVIEPESPNETR